MKKKIKNKLAITFGLTAMLGVVSLGVIHDTQQYENKENIVKVERKVQPKYASYNDEAYTITISENELTYKYENLGKVLSDLNYSINNDSTFFSDYYLKYDDDNMSFSEVGDYGDNEYLDLLFTYDGDSYYLSLGFNTASYIIVNDLDVEDYSHYTFSFEVEGAYYSQIKTAIELDIQANQPVSMGDSIVGAITSGLGLIPDLGSEFLTGFSALFWNSQTSSLTTFSYFALIFLGIAITMAVVKLVLAIIRGNTGA